MARFTGAFGHPELDASNLLLPELGFIKATDERFIKTLELTGKELMLDGKIMRYTAADDFGLPETAFLVCNFWYIDALAHGRPARRGARALRRHPVASQPLRHPVRGSARSDRAALGQFSPDLFDGGYHQFGHALSQSWEDAW